MARIPYIDPAEAPEDIAELLGRLPPMNVFRMLAHAGPEFRKFISFSDALLRKSSVDKWLLELAILRVGHRSGAPYEINQHEALARAVGGPDDKIAAIGRWPDDSPFTPEEELVLAFTDDVIDNVRASDATFVPLQKKLTPQGLVELTMAIGFYMMVSRLLNTFDVDIEDGGNTTLTLDR